VHPRNTFHSLVKEETTRLLRNCSDESQYNLVKEKMLKAFRDREYPAKLIKKAQQSVPFSNRPNLLTIRKKRQCSYDTFLILEYTNDLNIKELLNLQKRGVCT